MKSESIAELAKALCKAQGEFENAHFDTENTFYKSRYATLAACFNACRKILSKHGLSVIQSQDYREGKRFLITTLLHTSGEFIDSTNFIDPVKPDPQGVTSAITYGRRTDLCSIIGLATEDDDGNAASARANPSSPTQQPFPSIPEMMGKIPLKDVTQKVRLYRGETAAEKSELVKIISGINPAFLSKDVDALHYSCIGKSRIEIDTIVTNYFLGM